MHLFKTLLLEDSVEINTTPEKIWDFFTHLEENYKRWHPEDHVVFKWIGEPMKTGSKWMAEEVVHGKIFKLRGKIGEAIPNYKIVFNYAFPISLVAPRFEWIIKHENSKTFFIALSYLRAGELFYKIAKREMEWKMAMHNKHVKEEGENLKRMLEKA